MTLKQLAQQAAQRYNELKPRVWKSDVEDAYVNSLIKQGAPQEHIDIFRTEFRNIVDVAGC